MKKESPPASASEESLKTLHAALAEEFLKRVRSGGASPADLNAARQFLKDNDISCDGPHNPAVASLADSLPDKLPEVCQ